MRISSMIWALLTNVLKNDVNIFAIIILAVL